VWPSCHV